MTPPSPCGVAPTLWNSEDRKQSTLILPGWVRDNYSIDCSLVSPYSTDTFHSTILSKSTDSPGRGACGVRASARPRRAACWVPGSTPGPGWGPWGRQPVDVSPTSKFLSVAIGKISLGLGLTPATARRQTSPDKVTFKKEAKHSGRFQLTLSLSPGGPQGEQDADQQQHVGAPGAAPTGAGPSCARFQIRCTSSCETRI